MTRIRVESRWRCLPVIAAAFINRSTSLSARYSRGRTSAFLGFGGGNFPENDAWDCFFEVLIFPRIRHFSDNNFPENSRKRESLKCRKRLAFSTSRHPLTHEIVATARQAIRPQSGINTARLVGRQLKSVRQRQFESVSESTLPARVRIS